ncbi:MAG: NAD(P)-dependent oxidoreductase [Lachnospiraceae bacterium]|nr:NAD(P)-dependent oxidoreductase [Lachnospiraceae bacterium]
MWTDNEIYKADLNEIISDNNIPWQLLKEKDILITGATGLIGSLAVNALLYANQVLGLGCRIHAVVRNIDKAEKQYDKQLKADLGLRLIVQDICSFEQFSGNLDYIIHGASLTASKSFINEPVETITTAIKGTEHMLELARRKKVKSFIYLSSMEIYGTPDTEERITEEHESSLNAMVVRNSYPISKLMCENMCACYALEYGIKTTVMRLTQTFGPGVDYNDGRVFAEFARCVLEEQDIVLHTAGKTKRSYLYTADTIRAIFTILLCGNSGEAYNAANESTYCSIYDMACLAAKECAGGKIAVKRETEPDINTYGYLSELYMNLDTAKLKKLGWKPLHDLNDMFKRMCDSMRS